MTGEQFWRNKLQQELIRTKHNASGDLLRSIRFQAVKTSSGYELKLIANDYITIINRRFVPKFSPGSGIKKSKYISALISWAAHVKPGLSKREQRSFAFATAFKAKRRRTKGHPTRNPLDGVQRLRFIERVFSSKSNQREFANSLRLELNEKPINVNINL